jgi:hypothetical protein
LFASYCTAPWGRNEWVLSKGAPDSSECKAGSAK